MVVIEMRYKKNTCGNILPKFIEHFVAIEYSALNDLPFIDKLLG